MKKVGIIASDSSETEASVLLNEGMERVVKVEDMALIENRSGNRILAVCRKGTGSNDNIRASSFTPGVAYAKRGKKPSSAKEFYDFKLSVIGDVTDGLRQNKLIIAPSSDVYIFDDEGDNPMEYLGRGDFTVGYYKEHPNWPVPVNEKYIPYHVGIFSVTGGGKSFLARYEIIPLLRRAGCDVLIFDWKGSDYVPHFDAVVTFSEIAFDDEVVMSYLTSKMDYFGYSGDYKYRNSIRDALEDVIYEGEWRRAKAGELLSFLESHVTGVLRSENLDSRGNLSSFGSRYIRKFRKYVRKLSDEDLANIAGWMTPSDVVALARKEHVVVLDISESGKDEKLSIFLSIAKHLKEQMEKKQSLNMALVIDEAPQYAPYMPRGIEYETTELISQLCALGRSYGLSVVLLSQGIAGEIGINASIRRNLNTQFIGKIHPLDINEASTLLAGLDIDPRFLVSLPAGHFYLLGSMNPSPVPLLITFTIDPEEK